MTTTSVSERVRAAMHVVIGSWAVKALACVYRVKSMWRRTDGDHHHRHHHQEDEKQHYGDDDDDDDENKHCLNNSSMMSSSSTTTYVDDTHDILAICEDISKTLQQ